jgi:hypothetical protein
MMHTVLFTQYLRPDGRRRTIGTNVGDALKPKVETILANGFWFEIEMLTTGQIHMTISDDDGDYDSRICINSSPIVTQNVESLIADFDINAALQQRAELC